jgi:hypothetical protein
MNEETLDPNIIIPDTTDEWDNFGDLLISK